MKYVLVALCIVISLGCRSASTIVIPPPEMHASQWDVVCWSEDMRFAGGFWLIESQSRLQQPVIFIAHGGYHPILKSNAKGMPIIELVWYVYPDAPRKPMSVQAVSDTLANIYPDRNIILIVCNSLGHHINTERVFYAINDVWAIPDRNTGPASPRERRRNDGGVGSIWEFVSHDKRDVIYPPVRTLNEYLENRPVLPLNIIPNPPTTIPSAPIN